MKFLYVWVAILLLYACNKDLESKPVNAFGVNSVKSNILGRQHIITVPTGNRTYPTSKALLWLPINYDSALHKRYPLIINLYGQEQCGTDLNLLLAGHTMSEYIAEGFNATATNPRDSLKYHFIVFSPQCPTSWGWSAPQVKVMLQTLKSIYRIDTTRIYLTGFSCGGWGLWSCITDDKDLCSQFAAICPISSAAAGHPDKITNVDKYGIACWSICGDQDAFYKNSVQYTNTINANNPPIRAKLRTLKGVGHTALVQAYNPRWRPKDRNLYEWLLQYHK